MQPIAVIVSVPRAEQSHIAARDRRKVNLFNIAFTGVSAVGVLPSVPIVRDLNLKSTGITDLPVNLDRTDLLLRT